MQHDNSSMTDMDWANVRVFVAAEQRNTVRIVAPAVGLAALLCITMTQPDYWFLWFLTVWGGVFAVNRIFKGKAAAATLARDELRDFYMQDQV